ncbi:unnamed protein product [Sphenostylis stenocarpa]|uniref:Uncharacterized protein n=1 Tax=Sphenostylis stenocarpa TaxID=92480 RepID=A0AA86RZ06_9FABA|nr:unnamed protein product [Sphenostylis stenocarpa]
MPEVKMLGGVLLTCCLMFPLNFIYGLYSIGRAQVGGLVMLQPEVGGFSQNFYFAGIDKVRSRKPVIAGDTLVMRMTLTKLQKRFGICWRGSCVRCRYHNI